MAQGRHNTRRSPRNREDRNCPENPGVGGSIPSLPTIFPASFCTLNESLTALPVYEPYKRSESETEGDALAYDGARCAAGEAHGLGRRPGGVSMNMTDYEQTRRTFRLDPPADFNFTRDVVDAWAKREPNKIAIVHVDT